MPNSHFQFKRFLIQQDQCSMKVTTDACLFGAWVAKELQDKNIQNILDVGAGTALLSLMLAQQSSAMIDAIELQHNDYLQAASNINASKWKEHIHVLHGDAIDFDFKKKYDVIISNPPFYDNDLKAGRVEKNIAHHSLSMQLTDLIKIIMKNLNPSGEFYFLLPYKRTDEMIALAKQNGLFIHKMINVYPHEEKAAFRIMIQGGFENKITEYEDLVIKNQNQYTKDFIQLLEPYYLYL